MQQKEIIKEKIRERYGKIALTGNNNNNDNSDCCFMPVDWYDNDGNRDISSHQSTKLIGYHCKYLESIPQVSILSVGCSAPIDFANIQSRETIVDLGSGAGIDILLSANRLGKLCKVIGIDITDEMLEKARRNTKDNGHINAEFRKRDIEKRITIEDNTVDIVISNCVINLTTDKVSTFNEINRILDQMVDAAKYQLAGR